MTDSKSGKVGSVLVIGAGIAGVQASLDLAEMGYQVHLVERTAAIGGRMVQLDRTFPINDCSNCVNCIFLPSAAFSRRDSRHFSPVLNECGGHVNIEMHTLTDVLDVTGEPGNMRAKLLKKARYIDLTKCTSCGECAEVCPIEAPNLFNMGMDSNKVVYKPYPHAFPNAFAIHKAGAMPCRLPCPASVNAHGYVAMIKQGKFKEALEIILEDLPLPGTLGRICAHPCEEGCRRGQVEEPLSIRSLERLAADQCDILDVEVACAEERPEKVAVVGAGPAGLSAAYQLARQGIKSTIFEALSVPGGMLRVGIPDFRLPKDVLSREIEAVTRLGVEIKYDSPLGPDLTVEDLEKQGFKAVFLAMGARLGRKLDLPDEDAQGVRQAVGFLKDVNLGPAPEMGQKVLVIGGGQLAVDAARSAVRLGAAEVTVVSLEAAGEMPAYTGESEAAAEEGVAFLHRWSPTRFLTEDGRVRGIELKAVTQVFDENHQFSPTYDESTTKTVEADTVIVAVGQTPDTSPLKDVQGLSFTPDGLIDVDPVSLATGRPGVFAAGDMQTGPGSAIEAIAGGKEAAISMVRYLNGEDLTAGREPMDKDPDHYDWRDIPADVETRPRPDMPKISLEQRKTSFDEVEAGLDPEQGVLEAARCLDCSYCCDCRQCVKVCQPGALTLETLNMKDEVIELDVGSVVVAAGFDAFDSTSIENLGYASSPNVVTAMEFERLLAPSGPYKGRFVRPSDGQAPKKIAWLQCVGSRDINLADRPYCSAVCCMYAIKQALIAKEYAAEDVETTIFFMDIRTSGKDYERYYEGAKAAGVRFVRCRVHTVDPEPDDRLSVRYVTESGELMVEDFDMVVHSVGLEPSAGFTELAQRLDIDLTEDGFARAGAFQPVNTSRPGIFMCGAISEPKDIPFTVMEASAAASAATADLSEARFTRTPKLEYPAEKDVSGQAPRIGVFVCHCGINIGGVVDVPAVTDYVRTLPFVELADHNLFTCSQDIHDKISRAIVDNNLNRVVVAACSPRTHEPLFREALEKAGLNKFLLEMANIRGHDSWVHRDDPERATQKAKDLIRGAVAKVALLEPLHRNKRPITKEAIVVGGGVAGMTSALALAEQGFPVHLIEKSDRLGGNALKLNQTWRGEDIKAYVRDLTQQVEDSDKITVHFESEVAGCEGSLGVYVTTVQTPEGRKRIPHGAVVVASGGHPLTTTEYLHGQHPSVLTILEMDEVLAQDEARIKKAQAVAFIQCVGSREPEHPYCSRVCCTHSVESAIRIKEMNPEAAVYILYRDIRTYGFRETLYKKAREVGVIFIRYEVENKPRVESAGADKVRVTVDDPILGRPVAVECDLVGLAVAIVPNEGQGISEIYEVARNADGFFQEAHRKLRPADASTEGIFLAGLAHAPKPIEESIAQARAAAARAMTVLTKDFISVGGVVAVVDPDKCAVCLTCVRTCPYEVPKIDAGQGGGGHAMIEPALCQGCGMCVSECPGKAISLQHFTDRQLLANTKALIA